MESIVFEGVESFRRDNYWVDSSQQIAPLVIQEELDKRYAKKLRVEGCSTRELLRQADEFKAIPHKARLTAWRRICTTSSVRYCLKNNGSFALAAKFYKQAPEHADRRDRSFIYPRLTSCYRALGHATEVIKLMTYIKTHDGMDMITPVLLTSAAAAYCDLGQYENALKCAKRAYAMYNGRATEELHGVFGRIKKEMN